MKARRSVARGCGVVRPSSCRRLWLAVGAAVVFCAADGHAANEDDFLRPVGRPPVAAPQRRQGGEALPPLPLPATPLRRSEKKRPPSPATLIGKVVWGSYLDYTWDDGQVTRVYDWNMVPADCQQVLRAAREHLGLEYKAETTNLQTFNATPATLQLGAGEMLPAMEKLLVGLVPGSRHIFELEPENAFGPHRAELIERVKREHMPDEDIEAMSIMEFTAPDGSRTRPE